MKYPLLIYFSFYIPEWNSVSTSIIYFLAAVPLVGVLFIGVYPALTCLSLAPQELFGRWRNRTKATGPSNILSAFQYLTAFTLIIWLFSINDQITFILNNDLGINRDQVIVMDLPVKRNKTFASDLRFLKNQLNAVDGVEGLTVSTNLTGDKNG